MTDEQLRRRAASALDMMRRFGDSPQPSMVAEFQRSIDQWHNTETFKREQNEANNIRNNIARLKNQILAQNTTSQWGGEGFGSVDANANAMAEALHRNGITDIKDFGRQTVQEPKTYQPELRDVGWLGGSQTPRNSNNIAVPQYDGENNLVGYSEMAPTGRWFETLSVYDGEGSLSYSYNSFATPEQIQQFKLSGSRPQAVMVDTDRTQFVNKATGQPIEAGYAFAGGDIWSGTFAGKDSTAFAVQFDPQGTPYFYTTQGRGSKDKRFIAPLAIGLMFVPGMQGIGASIGAAVAPTVAVGTQVIIGNAIVQGVLAEAQGGDFIKGAALSAAGSLLPGVTAPISEALGNTAVSNIVANAITTGALSEIAGGDFLDGAIAGALSAGAGQLTGETLGLEGRAASVVGTLIVQGVVAELKGGDVTDALIAGAVSGALTYKPTEAGGITNRVVDEAIPQGDVSARGTVVGPTENITKSVTDFLSNKPDYSLTSDTTFPKLDGLNVAPVTDAGSVVGVSPVDYSLVGSNITDGLGLNIPTSPNIPDMGGGQGITITKPEGVLSESGVTPTGTLPVLGDPDSFINKDITKQEDEDVIDATEREGSLAKETETSKSIDVSKLIDAGVKLLGGAAVTSAVTSATRSSTPLAPVNLDYGDLYKDAPIKGFSMRQGADGRFTPFIGEKAQLAKGGFVDKRLKPTGLASRR